MVDVNLIFVLGAGILSFLSPCNLPLYPMFISYITGISISDIKKKKGLTSGALLHTFVFITGFSTIFVVLGLSTTLFAEWFINYNNLIRKIGAVIILVFGLVTIGLVKPTFMMKTKQLSLSSRPSGYVGTYLIGLAFAAGWTPCIGPILASVIALSLSSPQSGVFYMFVYSIGFSVPFIIMTLFINRVSWLSKHSASIMRIGGFMMILFGVLLYFDGLTRLTSFLVNNVFNGFMGF
ncbi:cytochrome c biogenesis protein CcdA [Shouchella sp. 1P09AA]|uniref:cytochrome c biogenesis CcdA family protein n=1 Tax=unclassified Shouchella TaxID=2893065 RepID=UPI0039A139DE